MKVEIVKVKVNKLREVRKQLRKGYNKNENLKALLTSQDKEKHENNLLYNSIMSLFQDETDDVTNISSYSENLLPDQSSDFYDMLNSLESKPDKISAEDLISNFMVADTTGMPGGQTSETTQFTDPIYQTVDKSSINNLSYLVCNCSNGFECTDDKIHLYKGVETGDILLSENSVTNINRILNINNTNLEPSMVDLEQFYAPNELLNLAGNEDAIAAQNVCNKKENSWLDTLETNGHIQNKVTLDNACHLGIGEDTLQNLINGRTLVNPSTEKATVTPLELNCSGLNLMVAAMEQLQGTKEIDGNESHDYEKMKLLKDYSLEQRLNIINAAKSLYTKRTRTLLHWLDPKLPMAKMKYTLDESWNNLPHWQKEVYVNQVLGPIVKETVIPMLNPQLMTEVFKPPESLFTTSTFPKSKRMPQKSRVSIVSSPKEDMD